MTRRQEVRAGNHSVIDSLTQVLVDAVDELSEVLQVRYEAMVAGEVGDEPRKYAHQLFNYWCEQSGIVPPVRTAAMIEDEHSDGASARKIAQTLSREIGFSSDEASAAADQFLVDVKSTSAEKAAAEATWDLYTDERLRFYTQTAHQIIGRILLYRVGEDANVFKERASGTALESALKAAQEGRVGAEHSSLSIVQDLQQDQSSWIPTIYKQGALDWWVVDSGHRRALKSSEQTRLAQLDRSLDRAFEGLLVRLDTFEFSSVDVDVWREVYQQYLPPKQRLRLGGFYTPEPIAELMLDLSGYHEDTLNLCKVRAIDFASGSGTFVVQLALRLLRHLDNPMECHKQIQAAKTPQQSARLKLDILLECVHAVDVHLFAAFLTTLNLLFIALPIYLNARRHDPTLAFDPAVFPHDALERRAGGTTQLTFTELNSRGALTEEAEKRFDDLTAHKFDLVIGNPPWGGILKGTLSPLFDPEKKRQYKEQYADVAYGKYDFFALFIQRGLEWLKTGGTLALITQNTYLGKDWGQGTRGYLADNATIRALIDLEPHGQLLFDAMNSPCITVARKSPSPSGEAYVVQVDAPENGVPGSSRSERIEWVAEQARRGLIRLLPKKGST